MTRGFNIERSSKDLRSSQNHIARRDGNQNEQTGCAYSLAHFMNSLKQSMVGPPIVCNAAVVTLPNSFAWPAHVRFARYTAL